MGNDRRANRKKANRARHRFLSIARDAENLSKIVHEFREFHHSKQAISNWPLVPNQRCGLWYTQSLTTHDTPCYFKSTDGHKGTWNFSLQRLNFALLELAARHGGCMIVDASRTKIMPDSFSRTVPIWCAVLNQAYIKLKAEMPTTNAEEEPSPWDSLTYTLFTPSCCIDKKEVECMQARIDTLTEEVLAHGCIDPVWLLRTLKRPLRPYWITQSPGDETDVQSLVSTMNPDQYTCLICISCSVVSSDGKRNQQIWVEDMKQKGDLGYWYTPGAADDEESFSRGITPQLYWKHQREILEDACSANETDKAIDRIVMQYRQDQEMEDAVDKSCTNLDYDQAEKLPFDTIGETGIAIGSRRAGRPPLCWEHFDAVLNITDMQYDELKDGNDIPVGSSYLHAPVKEGKRDRTELEKWMPVCLCFILINVSSKRKVLVHCAQGKDRSVAVAMASLALFYNCENLNNTSKSLEIKPWCNQVSTSSLEKFLIGGQIKAEESQIHCSSGLDCQVVDALTGRNGRDAMFAFLKTLEGDGKQNDITKQFLRLILNVVQRHRDVANPSRKTMQKLNRFLMSRQYEE